MAIGDWRIESRSERRQSKSSHLLRIVRGRNDHIFSQLSHTRQEKRVCEASIKGSQYFKVKR